MNTLGREEIRSPAQAVAYKNARRNHSALFNLHKDCGCISRRCELQSWINLNAFYRDMISLAATG
jgi:hypothetical protein